MSIENSISKIYFPSLTFLQTENMVLRQQLTGLIRWRLKRGTEQVAERRNEGTEQLQIVEEPVMNGIRV